MSRRRVLQAAIFVLSIVGSPASGDEFERAVQSAAKLASPVVVRIETTGGAERIANVERGEGKTTGVIVAPDGWIVSSLFGFAFRPDAILVRVPTVKGDLSGPPLPAKLVAVDHVHRLVLLKVDAKDLPTAKPAKSADLRVGSTVVALGRAIPSPRPTLAVGIVSATNRVWGRAVQTDAKVSPTNYGGPLVNLDGEVVGILAPMSPLSDGVTAGIEWYDSGIAFAAPLDKLITRLERWQKGDLMPGRLGVTLATEDYFLSPLRLSATAWRSPADLAGVQPGDVLLAMGDIKVRHRSDFLQAIGTRLVGDPLTIEFQRGEQVLKKELVLVEKFPTYREGYLGVRFDRRSAAPTIAEVMAGSPAALAKLQPGDVIRQVAGQPTAQWSAFVRAFERQTVGDPLDIELTRGAEKITSQATLAPLPVLSTLPAPAPALAAAEPKPWRDGEGNLFLPPGAKQLLVVLLPAEAQPSAAGADWKALAESSQSAVLLVSAKIPPKPLIAQWKATLAEPGFAKASVALCHWHDSSPAQVGALLQERLHGIVSIQSTPPQLPSAQPGRAKRLLGLAQATSMASLQNSEEARTLRDAGHHLEFATLGEVVAGGSLPAAAREQLRTWLHQLDLR